MRGAVLLLLGIAAYVVATTARGAVMVDPGGSMDDDEMPDDELTPDDVQPAGDYLSAMLYMIGAAEVSPRAMTDGSAFTTFYGGAQFTDLSDHPTITGELRGVRLPDEMCRRAGFSPGCVSTAAGFAQINRPTWDQVRKAGAWGPRLPDFSPDSQREAARRVLILAGALEPLEQGDLGAAITAASARWASLAGSTSGQRQHPLPVLVAWFNDGLTGAG